MRDSLEKGQSRKRSSLPIPKKVFKSNVKFLRYILKNSQKIKVFQVIPRKTIFYTIGILLST